MSKRDYYEILGVGKSATDQELKSAYRKLALQFHPDRNPGNTEAEEKFKEINEAYGILSNSQSRERYNAYGYAGVKNGGGYQPWEATDFSGFEDLLGDIFSDFLGGGRSRRNSQRGADLRYDLEITLEQAAAGFKTDITIPRLENCHTCNGSGAAAGTTPTSCAVCGGAGQVRFQQGFFSVSRTCNQCRGAGKTITNYCRTCGGQGRTEKDRKIEIKIPAGVDTGARLRLAGEGEAGTTGVNGDLFVIIHVKEHHTFERQGNNLYVSIPITFSQAALGSEITVPTLDGEDSLTIPEGTQTGAILRVKGKGIVSLQQGYGRGDLFIVTTIVTPTKLTKEQKKLLEQFSDLEEKQNHKASRKFGNKVKDIFS